MWEKTFVGVSVLVGVPYEEALAALPDGSAPRLDDLPQKLRDPRRGVRAAALAQVAQAVVFAVEETALR